MLNRAHVTRIAFGLLILSPAWVSASADDAPRLSFDFRDGVQGWEADFSDYPGGAPGLRGYELEAELRELPEEVGPGTGFWMHGFNHSDDLFMFLKRRLGPEDGILPQPAVPSAVRPDVRVENAQRLRRRGRRPG